MFRLFDRLGLGDAISDIARFPENRIMMDGVSAELQRKFAGVLRQRRFGARVAR